MIKAAATASANSLFALVEKSGLLSDRLEEVQALAKSCGNARELAKQLVARSLVTRWQASQLLNGFYQFNLGKYRLLDQIGVGRIGREFLAEHVQLGKRVAIKLVSRNLTADAARLQQFLSESRRAVALDHPHLVHSHDVDQEGQRYYVVTEFVDGEDLKKRVERQGPCSPDEALHFIRQAAEGLQHAAVSGVLHGDLKPTNMLIDKQGSLKVADLGFARLVDGAPKAQPPGDSKEQNLQSGVEYCAPEVLNAVEGDLDCRADMYSLGQSLYFLLKGMAPSIPAVAIEERAASLNGTSVSPQIASFFAQLTSPQAKERPASWKEVLDQLRSLDVKPPAGAAAMNGGATPPAKRKPLMAQAIALSGTEAVAVATLEPQAQEVVEVADSQPIIVAIDHGRGRLAESAEAQGVVAGETASADSGAKKKPARSAKGHKVEPKLVLGVAIGGGVLLLLLAGSILWMLLGGGNTKSVADKPKQKPAVTANEESESTPDEETTSETDSSKTPEEPKTKSGDETPKPPTTSATDVSKPAVVTPEPKPEPTPEPKPEPAPTPTATPEPPKVEPAPAQPVVKPFEKLPAFVSLPDANKPGELSTLGALALPADKLMRIVMHGGEGATRNKSVFSLHNANADTDERNWEVQLQKVIVAKLHREPDKLTFEWTAEAVNQPVAANLGNCLLQLSAGPDEHYVALRTPVEYDPVTIDLEKGSKWTAAIENLPSSTVVDLVGLDPAAFPNPEFKTETTGKIKGMVMWYGPGLDTRSLGLLIDKKEIAKRVDVNLTCVFRADPLAKDTMAAKKLNKRDLPEALQGLEQQLNILNAEAQAIERIADAQQKTSAKQANDINMQRVREQRERIGSALELHKKAHNSAVVHMRVCYDTGSGKVVLAQTKGAPQPEPLGRRVAEKLEAK